MKVGTDLVDADIRRARTLPSSFYRDPALYEEIRDKVFARSWQFVGDRDLVKVPGSVHPSSCSKAASTSRCCSPATSRTSCTWCRTCAPTAAPWWPSIPAACSNLRCRYHGRRFALDGRFLSMPEFQEARRVPLRNATTCPRSPSAAGRAGSSPPLDPAHPLAEVLEEVERRVGFLPWDEFNLDAARSRDYLVRANWALYCDNYLEGFHIPFVHPAWPAALDYGSYRTEIFRWSNLQVGVAQGDDVEVFDLPAGSSPDHGQKIAAYYFWVFPNLMLNFYPWGLSVNVVKPLAVDRTRVSFLSWVWDAAKLEDSAGAQIDRVEREDEEVVESVQRGMRSRLYDRGRYSPTRETGPHHFHRLLLEVLQR